MCELAKQYIRGDADLFVTEDNPDLGFTRVVEDKLSVNIKENGKYMFLNNNKKKKSH